MVIQLRSRFSSLTGQHAMSAGDCDMTSTIAGKHSMMRMLMRNGMNGVDAVRAPCARRARAVTASNTRCARRGHAMSTP